MDFIAYKVKIWQAEEKQRRKIPAYSKNFCWGNEMDETYLFLRRTTFLL